MNIVSAIQHKIAEIILEKWGKDLVPDDLTITETRKEFEGDYTLVTFPLVKLGIGKPDEIAQVLGELILAKMPQISTFNVIKGFLNISLSDSYWLDFFYSVDLPRFVRLSPVKKKKIVIEFSSPNTNKPLHLGHVRNNFLGDSVARILSAAGHDVSRVCLYNDRGIAITKTMVMYINTANGATPESAGKKPDFFVVDFYVGFGEKLLEESIAGLIEKGIEEKDARAFCLKKDGAGNKIDAEAYGEIAKKVKFFLKEKGLDPKEIEENTPLMRQAREMLLKWEAGDPETLALWKKLNDWVYEGFETTYRRMGISFDKVYYESETYLLGGKMVADGLEKGVFFRKDDGSVWIDLSDDGLDEKVVLRADGTSVYITQDIGSAELRYQDFQMDESIYVVANEQDYHFKVLKLIMQKMGRPGADGIAHFSYGMVDLPSGKMKTREGTTVDADNLMDEVIAAAEVVTRESGKTEGMSQEEMDILFEKIALAALKFFILRVDPKNRMVFDPEESVQLAGDTGPFVQYSYARSISISRRAGEVEADSRDYTNLELQERELLKRLSGYPQVIAEAAEKLSPAEVAGYVMDLAKNYNRFYHEVPVIAAPTAAARKFRLELSALAGEVIREALDLLGIEVPERM